MPLKYQWHLCIQIQACSRDTNDIIRYARPALIWGVRIAVIRAPRRQFLGAQASRRFDCRVRGVERVRSQPAPASRISTLDLTGPLPQAPSMNESQPLVGVVMGSKSDFDPIRGVTSASRATPPFIMVMFGPGLLDVGAFVRRRWQEGQALVNGAGVPVDYDRRD